MSAPQTATGVISFGGNFYGLGIKDANGNYALAQTSFTQSPFGILIPAPADANGTPIHAAESSAPSFTGTTGTISSGNANTSLSITLGSLAVGNGLFDAKQATIRILNNATSQTITGLTLTLQDTVGGTAIPITYSATVSIASGGTYTWVVPLTSGIATNASLGVAFGTAPVAGSVSTTATFQGPGAPVTSLAGSNATYISEDYTQTVNVAAGSNMSIVVAPPAGVKWKLKNIYVNVPAPTGATSGTHNIDLQEASNAFFSLLDAGNTYSGDIIVFRNRIDTANTQTPSTEIGQMTNLLSAEFTNNAPCTLYYANQTNATQSGTITFKLFCEVTNIA